MALEFRMPNPRIDTEIIDKLYLELSHFTRAETKKELELKNCIVRLDKILKDNLPYTVEMQQLVQDILRL